MSDTTPGASGDPSDKSKRLRRPHQATQERLLNGVHDQNQNQNTGTESTLSANAPVFIPKFSIAPQQTQNFPVQTTESSYQQDTQEGLWEDFNRLLTFRPSHLNSAQNTSGGHPVTDMFRDTVFSLTTNPANMEEYLKPVLQALRKETSGDAILHDIVETLFEQCISEANFRYTGARMCKYLSNQLKTHEVFKSFRAVFLNRCSQEFNKREELLSKNVDRLCGLSMFFGELFLVMEIDTDTGAQKLGILRKAINDLETTLLSKPDDATVKCATQLLKLTGTAIAETTSLPGNFDAVFDIIKSLEKHPSLNKTSHCLVNSVLSRLEYNFGVESPSRGPNPVNNQQPATTPQANYAINYELNEPVFYNNVGQPITREEAGFSQEDGGDLEGLNAEEQEAFLQWEAETYMSNNQWIEPPEQGYGAQPWSTGEGYQSWSSPDDQMYQYQGQGYPPYQSEYSSDMDDEMQAAYEEFLKEPRQYPQ